MSHEDHKHGQPASDCTVCEAIAMAQANPEKTARDAKRMLGAIYRLSHGSPLIAVAKIDVLKEMRRERLLELTDEEYEAYKKKSIEEVREWRKANNS